MEIFTVKAEKVELAAGNIVQVEYAPENPELKNRVSHGAHLPLQGTIAETVAAYLPTAEAEMFSAVDQMFPNMYQRAE